MFYASTFSAGLTGACSGVGARVGASYRIVRCACPRMIFRETDEGRSGFVPRPADDPRRGCHP